MRTKLLNPCLVMRTTLYDAAQVMLKHSAKWSWLKAWTMKIVGSIRTGRGAATAALGVGMSGGLGNTSSKYAQITLDSTMTLPSCTSTGTTPRGFSFLNSAVN